MLVSFWVKTEPGAHDVLLFYQVIIPLGILSDSNVVIYVYFNLCMSGTKPFQGR